MQQLKGFNAGSLVFDERSCVENYLHYHCERSFARECGRFTPYKLLDHARHVEVPNLFNHTRGYLRHTVLR